MVGLLELTWDSGGSMLKSRRYAKPALVKTHGSPKVPSH